MVDQAAETAGPFHVLIRASPRMLGRWRCAAHDAGLALRRFQMDGIFHSMPVSVEIHHTSSDPGQREEITAHIEHALADQRGDWSVSIIGSQESDRWEMKILGPNGFERTYMLEGASGETEPQMIGRIVARMVK